MRKNYIDSDNFSEKFDEVATDLKSGGVSKLNDLAVVLNSIANVSGEETYYLLACVFGAFSVTLMNSRRTPVNPYMPNDMKQRLVATINHCVGDSTHHIERIGCEIKNGAYDPASMLEAMGSIQKLTATLQTELRNLGPARGVVEHNPLSLTRLQE